MKKIDVCQDLSHQKLTELPAIILEFPNLRWLYLEGNYLETIPDELFTTLENLIWLDLRDNRLKSIPKTIANHQSLQTLLLQGNQIESLPNELGLVPNLKVLHLTGNPITYPTKSIIEKGVKNIVEFLKTEYKSSSDLTEENKSDSDLKDLIVDAWINENSMNEKQSQFAMPILAVKKIQKPTASNEYMSPYRRKNFRNKVYRNHSKYNIYKNHPHYNSNKYLGKLPKKDNEIRVEEQYIKDLWIRKIREIRNKQEEALQRVRNREGMKNWRRNTKYKNNKKINYKPEVPFDTDPEYNKMPNRRDLQRPERSRRSYHLKPKRPNVDKLISDIVESLKNLERERNLARSTSEQMDCASREIKTILELQRRLSALKITNDKTV